MKPNGQYVMKRDAAGNEVSFRSRDVYCSSCSFLSCPDHPAQYALRELRYHRTAIQKEACCERVHVGRGNCRKYTVGALKNAALDAQVFELRKNFKVVGEAKDNQSVFSGSSYDANTERKIQELRAEYG